MEKEKKIVNEIFVWLFRYGAVGSCRTTEHLFMFTRNIEN